VSGLLDPVTAGAGGAVVYDSGVVFVDTVTEIILGAACVGSGVCEVIAGGAAIAGAGAGIYIIYRKVTKKSGKETGSDTPSWISQYPKEPGESCAAFAARILNAKYSTGSAKASQRGPGSEYSKIKKACERGGL
jgi:hypothetical protein